ncbi:cache domain-containing protein [Nitrosophilus kaiyonis]|uniref:cache domain-containing protein n=1 Tax=Nitrosophilus kaiyonis TaxID=2930200 RepID=UPI002493CB6B|nr:cache domain-containing protein [Nitrosophilus kaiyonis]
MKYFNEEKLPLLNFISNIFIIFLLMISIGYILIIKEYNDFKIKSKNIENEFKEEYRKRLKTEVDRVVDYINYYKSQTEYRLKNEIKNRVYQANDIATYIYNKYKNLEDSKKIKSRIKDALLPIRWRNGYSYLWIVDTNGTAVLFPINPNIENQNIIDYKDANGRYILKEAKNIVLNQNEGYITKIFVTPPNKKELFEQIAFVKLFKPFNWIIGTGETLNDIEKDIKQEILKRVYYMRFNKEGYFGVIDFEGNILCHPFIKRGTNILKTDNKKYKKIGEKLIEIGKQGGFLTYDFRKLTSNKIAKKLTYTKSIKDWGWIVYAGIYLDDLQKKILDKQKELEKELNEKIKILLFIFGSFSLLALLLSLAFSNKLNAIFENYRKKIEYRTKRLEKLNEELKEKEKQAQAASKAKTIFISNISHDIRTPLNAILGYAQILNKDVNLDEIQKEKINKILKHGNYLLELLDDIIEISKIETGKIGINEENFDLKKFLENIKEMYEDKAKSKGLKWDVIGIPKKETFVKGDKKKLFRVLINLLSNAFKYTDSGEIKLIITPKENNVYEFSIIDTGIGIEKEEQKNIFEIFTQAKSGQERGGKGLGLSIAYKYIKLMGGELKLESEPRKGSKFYFEIKLKPSIEKKQEIKKSEENYKKQNIENISNKFTIEKKLKEKIINLAKMGNITNLKKEITNIENQNLKNRLFEYINSFDLENLILFLNSIKEK